ncbi:uncharacterized protein LOC100680331 isoform X2 [Nasonia vitripennis]|nr:uncharacterized protein LOC100680331 isoform X2 [Nasonia vitripennis]XP_032451728.1 uncharacterized protein LOC100680331 isoform X2 [Nasonia vitripennis]
MVQMRLYDHTNSLGWNRNYLFNDPLKTKIDIHNMHILLLPEEMLFQILSHFNFETIGKLRLVCRQFNKICCFILNAEYTKLQGKVKERYEYISQMPRQIPMKCDKQLIILLSAELYKLHFIFKTHVKENCCCFFAGSFLDEAYTLLEISKSNAILNVTVGSCEGTDPFAIMNKLFILHDKLLNYLPHCDHYRTSIRNHPAIIKS